MATPKPGEIRCPTCHRSTPPAAFCTQCGSAIPSDARIRPRGMDRDELQDRIRARRVGGEPYRRGAVADEAHGGYERYVPDPADAQAKRSHRPDERRQDSFVDRVAPVVPIRERPVPEEPPVPEASGVPQSIVPPIELRQDVTRESDEWSARLAVPPPPVEPAWPAMDRDESPPEPEHVDYFDDAAYADEDGYAYDYQEWDEGRDRGTSGAGAFAILGFLALGVLALLGGAVLAGVFSGGPSTGGLNPTLSPSPTLDQSVAPTVSAAPSIAPSPSAPASGEPVTFPDGFTADAQPCLPGSAGATGCQSNGASNGGVVDIWVGFKNGTESDVIGAALIGPDGSPIGEGSIDLARIGCGPTCPGGWTYFPFRNLSPGTYTVLITRNGEHASETSFEVS
jgi:hypothetical protein